MANLVLHIGAHKTGTSYVQGLFFRNRDRLAAAGLHYPAIGPNEAHHALASPWIPNPDIPDAFFGAGGPDAFWQDRIIGPYADAPGTLFLSAETFSRFEPTRVDMAALAARLQPFDDVRILYTLRQQAELVSSVWTQIAKVRPAPTLRAYVERAYTDCMAGGVPLDHGAVYDHLLTGFAPGQIELLDYAAARRRPGGLAQALLDVMRIDLRADSLTQPPQDVANISPDPLALWVATQVTRGAVVPPPGLVDSLHTILCPAPGIDPGITPGTTSLLARHEYNRLRRRFVPLNRALVRRVQHAQPGFAFPDIPALPEAVMYRDDITAQHWVEIAASLYDRLQSDPKDVSGHRSRLRRLLGGA